MPTDELSLAPEKDFIEEDPRSKVIKNELEGDEELDAAMDLLKEKYDVPAEDTTSGKPEPKKPEQGADTSEKPEDKTETEQKPKDGDQELKKPDEPAKLKEPVKPEEIPAAFVLTNELIQKQPEEYRDILKKYEGKGKADLAKAAANAVALKSPYLKDNEKAIGALAEKFETLSNDDIVKTLIETQAQIGVAVEPPGKQKLEPLKEEKIELPALPDDGEVKKILNKETVKRLKKIYPNMPEDMESEEYKEWERDLQDTGGLVKVKKFLSDLDVAETTVKTELQKVVYAQTNLQNLYNESPDEILPILTDENLPKLKRLNDNFRTVNNQSLTEEVDLIKKELVKYGITETDLGVDLTLKKDENGSYFNDGLNSLMLIGNTTDSSVVGQMGKVPFLRKGQLTKKFIFENNAKILTCLAKKNTEQSKLEVAKLKTETLNTLGTSKSTGLKTITNPEDVKKITDDSILDKLMDEIKNKY